jgi:predicted Fe-Mo cluster-binding NifX family protein
MEKIAIITNDGLTIAGHFGMAEYYKVFTLDAGKIIAQEQRPKPHHQVHPDFNQAQQHDHIEMFAPIQDCQVLVSGGMRTMAYEKARANGLQVFMARGKIEDILKDYLAGSLVSDPARINKW